MALVSKAGEASAACARARPSAVASIGPMARMASSSRSTFDNRWPGESLKLGSASSWSDSSASSCRFIRIHSSGFAVKIEPLSFPSSTRGKRGSNASAGAPMLAAAVPQSWPMPRRVARRNGAARRNDAASTAHESGLAIIAASVCQPLLYVCSYDRCDLVDDSRATVAASSRSLAAFNVHTAVLLSRANSPTSLCSRVATARSQPGVASLSELCELTRKQSCAARRSSTRSFCLPHLGRFLLLFCRRREIRVSPGRPISSAVCRYAIEQLHIT